MAGVVVYQHALWLTVNEGRKTYFRIGGVWSMNELGDDDDWEDYPTFKLVRNIGLLDGSANGEYLGSFTLGGEEMRDTTTLELVEDEDTGIVSVTGKGKNANGTYIVSGKVDINTKKVFMKRQYYNPKTITPDELRGLTPWVEEGEKRRRTLVSRVTHSATQALRNLTRNIGKPPQPPQQDVQMFTIGQPTVGGTPSMGRIVKVKVPGDDTIYYGYIDGIKRSEDDTIIEQIHIIFYNNGREHWFPYPPAPGVTIELLNTCESMDKSADDDILLEGMRVARGKIEKTGTITSLTHNAGHIDIEIIFDDEKTPRVVSINPRISDVFCIGSGFRENRGDWVNDVPVDFHDDAEPTNFDINEEEDGEEKEEDGEEKKQVGGNGKAKAGKKKKESEVETEKEKQEDTEEEKMKKLLRKNKCPEDLIPDVMKMLEMNETYNDYIKEKAAQTNDYQRAVEGDFMDGTMGNSDLQQSYDRMAKFTRNKLESYALKAAEMHIEHLLSLAGLQSNDKVVMERNTKEALKEENIKLKRDQLKKDDSVNEAMIACVQKAEVLAKSVTTKSPSTLDEDESSTPMAMEEENAEEKMDDTPVLATVLEPSSAESNKEEKRAETDDMEM